MTRGRVTFGVGPGSLPSDAFMQGIPTPRVRDRVEEAIDLLVRLLNGETVMAKTDWYELIARFAIPKINKPNVNRLAPEDRLHDNNVVFRGEPTAAVGAKVAEHAAAKGVDKLSPDYLKLFKATRQAS